MLTHESLSATTMQFSLLGLLASAAVVSAVPAPDQYYSGNLPKRQISTCEANTIYCNSSDTFSLCAPGPNGNQEVFFGSVADGTYCDESENKIRANNYGDCSPDGQLFCDISGTAFFECDQGGLIYFGPVAAGTTCVDGTIVATN